MITLKQSLCHSQRVLKVLPVFGALYVLANANNVLRRKGLAFGTLDLVLDILPVVCLIKASIELYTGDLIPAKTTMKNSLEAAV